MSIFDAWPKREWQPGCTCSDCFYCHPGETWFEEVEVGYVMECCDPPSCGYWAYWSDGHKVLRTVMPDDFCSRWLSRYYVTPIDDLAF